MIQYLLLAASFLHLASAATHASPVNVSAPPPLPIFLRMGFSSVLEFPDAPTRVVLGNSQAFQVEKLDRSLVLRTLVAYATSNLFVYFKEAAPKLFILTASEDAEPTYFNKIEFPKTFFPTQPTADKAAIESSMSRVVSLHFDPKKDYLTVEVHIAATSTGSLMPKWDLIRLKYQSLVQPPYKLWAERKVVQKDSFVRVRLVFAKPNIPRDLKGGSIIIPIEGQLAALSLPLKGALR